MIGTSADYQRIATNMTRHLENIANRPMVSRETEYYRDHIGSVESIDDFLADRRLYAYAMKAFGLADMTYATAFMRKALEGGIDDRDSFANRLQDPRYREFVETFNFVRYEAATTAFDRARSGTIDRYLRQTLEEDAGRHNEGVRLALYFQRKAPELENVFEILGQPALLKVVQVALGIPAETASQDIDKQAATISGRLDLADFSDPQKLAAFLDRFATLWDGNNPAIAATVPNILVGPPTFSGLSADILARMQDLKFGGS